jgi:ATP-dependent Zn protease
MIDEEIRRILVDAEKEAMAIVADNESALHEIARVLQDQEVIDGEAVGQIVAEQRRNG